MTVEPRRTSRKWGIVVLLLAALLAWMTFALFTPSTSEVSSESFENIRIIQFDVNNGSVSVTGYGDDVSIETSTTSGFMGGDVEFRVEGETLRVIQTCPWFIGFSCRASFDITAPTDIQMMGQTSNGRIDLQSLEGAIDLRTSNGNINVAGVGGPLLLRTSNGTITATGLTSRSVDLTTSNGGITATFLIAPTTVSARTSNGGIEVGLPSDSPAFAVDASTSNGQVQTSIRTDPGATSTLTLHTSNGNIAVGYNE